MNSHYMTSIITIAVLVILSAYFSATETAFTSFSRIRMKHKANEGSKRAKRVMRLVAQQYDQLISTVLIVSNVMNIVIASIATLLFVDLYGSKLGVPLSMIVVSIIVIIFCIIVPKSIANKIPEKFCLFSASLIRLILILLAPLNFFFVLCEKLMTGIFSLDPDRMITEEELLTMVEEAETEGGINTEQSELIQNAIEFSELEAWDVLTPRVDVIAIEIDTPQEEIAKIFKDTGFSRLPVYDETIDKIIGVLTQKDFSNNIVNTKKEISAYVKPVVFMAGSVKIAMLLKKMQKIKTHIAVIVDEYGGTEGIVTMEDIIEELVGEIYDEHDGVISQEIVQHQDGSYRVLCSANVEKMLDYFDMEEEEMDVTTVNGFVVVALDKLPKVGDTFQYKNLNVTVTKADEKKALEINVVKEEESEIEGEKQ